jgi:Fe-S cluster assembly protein SufD
LDNTIREYTVGKNQHKNYSFLIDDAVAGDQHMCFYLERNAKLVVEILLISTTIKVHVECILRGEYADARIIGAYLLDASHKAQITTLQHHIVPHTNSTLVMKGLLRDSAHAQYHGTVRIEKDARGSCASQENKNMLLSNTARAISVPSLEVLTHEVQCSHGSAIGRFDDEQLFYAASRGIDEKGAQQLLANAFFADLFVDEMMKRRVRDLI